jgi:monoamine oxidase
LGPGQDVAYALAHEYGIGTHRTYARGDTVFQDGRDIRRFHGSLPPIGPIAIAALALGMARLDLMARGVSLDAPVATRRSRAWDARSAGDWVARNVPPGAGRSLLDAAVRGLMTCDASEVSLLHLLYLIRSAGGLQKLLGIDGGYQQDLLEGGAGSMAEAITKELGDRVHLRTPVRAIARSGDRVRVIGDDIEVDAARVIVATPPALAARIEFTPALPIDHAQLLDRIPAGSITKFVVMYDDAFWRSNGVSGQSVGLNECIEMTLDAGPPSGRPGVLAAFAFGPHARDLAGLDADVRRRVVLDALTARFGSAAATPTELVEQDWAQETWSRGCYLAHFPPGVMTQYGDAVRRPCGRIHWAGTETATKSHGTIDGALRSGARAASEVIALS